MTAEINYLPWCTTYRSFPSYLFSKKKLMIRKLNHYVLMHQVKIPAMQSLKIRWHLTTITMYRIIHSTYCTSVSSSLPSRPLFTCFLWAHILQLDAFKRGSQLIDITNRINGINDRIHRRHKITEQILATKILQWVFFTLKIEGGGNQL